MICAVARGQQTIIPTGATVLQKGDKIYLTASARELESFFRKLNIFKARANNIMIVGASRITYYLVKELQDIQKRVTVIDSNAARCQAMSEKFPGALVIHGDGADSELLSGERQRNGRLCAPDRPGRNEHHPGHVRQPVCQLHGGRQDQPLQLCRPGQQKAWWTAWFPHAAVCEIVRYVRAMQNGFDSDNIKTLHRLVGGRVEALGSTSAPACLSSVYR